MGKRKRRSKSTTESDASSSKKPKKMKTTITIKKKRKNWSVDLDKRFKIMTGAVEDVIEKKMTIRKAAQKWGVKRSTLADRVTGRVELGRRSGPPTILTRAEEQMLAEWVISMAQRGFGFSKHKLLKTVKKILDKDKRTTMLKKKKNMPGNKWYRQFVKRNPRVKLVTNNTHKLDQLEKVAQLDKVAMSGEEYEALNCMLASYESESGSESESEFDSELDSVSESELEVESPLHSPSPSDVKLEMIVDTELVTDQELPSKPQVHSEPEPEPEPELALEHEIQSGLDKQPGSPPEDFSVDPNSGPDMSVGVTVTITTSE